MQPASSFRAASSNDRLGCRGFGRILLTSSRNSAGREGGTGADGAGIRLIDEGMRLLSALPSAFLFIFDKPLRQAEVRLGAAGPDVIQENRLAVARRLTEPNVAGPPRLVDKLPEHAPHFV